MKLNSIKYSELAAKISPPPLLLTKGQLQYAHSQGVRIVLQYS